MRIATPKYPKDGMDRSAAERPFHPVLNQPVERSEDCSPAFCFLPGSLTQPRMIPRYRRRADAGWARRACGGRFELRFELGNPGGPPANPSCRGARAGSAARAVPSPLDGHSIVHRPPPLVGRPRQGPDPEQGLATDRAFGRRQGRRRHQGRTLPIPQGQDAFPLGPGGGPAPAVVAHALKPLGPDGLQEPPHELQPADGAGLGGAVVLVVAERYTRGLAAFDLAFVQRGQARWLQE